MIQDLHQARHLVSAIVTQAIKDYQKLSRLGWIVEGRVNLPKPRMNRNGVMIPVRVRNEQFTRSDCEDLINFFKPGGNLDYWIKLARLNVSPDRVRASLCIKAEWFN